jgi:phenylalanyl-tRNA synthetase beta chain
VEELKLANPIVEDQTHLRATLIPGLVDVLKLNQARHTGAFQLFETGRIFRERDGAVDEMMAVGFLMAEDLDRVSWRKGESPDFFSVKRRVLRLAELARIDTANMNPTPLDPQHSGWQPEHAAGYDDPKGRYLIRFGLLDLNELHRQDIRGKVYAGMVAVMPDFLAIKAEPVRFKPFSSFPPALRDLALIVDRKVPANEVSDALLKLGRKATGDSFSLDSVTLFDLYEGKGLPEGTRSLAFSLAYASAERTLTDDEVNASFERLILAIEEKTPYQIRR